MKLPSFKWLILISILIALCYVNVRYEIFALNIPKSQGKEKAEGCFRVMTWNVNGPLKDKDGVVKKGILDEIKKWEPDILCFQELSPKPFKEMKVSLDSIFGYTDSMEIKNESKRYWLYSKKHISNFKRYNCVTKIDTTGFNQTHQKKVIRLNKGMTIFSAEIEVSPNRWITVFSCHLCSSGYSSARISMEKGSSWKDGIPLYIENYKLGKKIRDFEADDFRFYLDSLESADIPIIIAGDFNDWSGSYCMNTIRDDKYKDAWWKGGFGFGITYDDWNLKLRLDHILYSHHFQLNNVWVDKCKLSDHYSLITDIKLK